ncbi:hypothetical protein [Mesorhizobium sp. AA22]|uniref:hypothetical protein n=1 Tax=Mesorhizobium sp. AA22 TaxID=1854057 RepID=UPI0007FF3E83|nr:hypothetical protein [Mesorhizobium sp. AA22]QIA23646.1 hypothetical protein A9K68_019055 [Mesorhizobium sp. AA22]
MDPDEAPARPQKMSGWVLFGGIATAIYVAFIAFVLIDSRTEGFFNITKSNLSLNTFGDFLAGVCAPLAFLWLFIATMVQSQELALQREELRLTREEFRLNREVAKQQAEEARSQARFIGTQTAIIQASEIDKLIEIQMQAVVRRVNDIKGYEIFVGEGGERTKIPLSSSYSEPYVDFVDAVRALIKAAEDLRRIRSLFPERPVHFKKVGEMQAIHQLFIVIEENTGNASQKIAATLKNSDFSDAVTASEYLVTQCGG